MISGSTYFSALMKKFNLSLCKNCIQVKEVKEIHIKVGKGVRNIRNSLVLVLMLFFLSLAGFG